MRFRTKDQLALMAAVAQYLIRQTGLDTVRIPRSAVESDGAVEIVDIDDDFLYLKVGEQP